MADHREFPCLYRIGKFDHPGVLLVFPDKLKFVFQNGDADRVYSLSHFGAHRQHPKLPMIQLRFNKPDSKPEDVTFVFRDAKTPETVRFDILTAFLTTLTSVYQRLTTSSTEQQQRSTPAVAAETQQTSPTSKGLQSGTSTSAESTAVQLSREEKTQPTIAAPHKPPAVVVPAKLLEDQKRLLEEDEELAYAYEYLVLGGHVPADRFWEEHALELAANQSQTVPEEELFLAVPPQPPDKPPQSEKYKASLDEGSSKGLTYSANEQQLAQILAEHPPIRERYDTLVPLKVSHDEFWARFFQSRYFAQMTGQVPSVGADASIFPDFDPNAILAIPSAPAVQSMVEPTIDLITSENFLRPGFGSVLDEGALIGERSRYRGHTSKRAILERFNRHGFRAVQRFTGAPDASFVSSERHACKGHDVPSHVNRLSDPFLMRKRVLEQDTCLEDLKLPGSPTVTQLRLQPVGATGHPGASRGCSGEARDRFVLRLKAAHWEPAMKRLQAEDNKHCRSSSGIVSYRCRAVQEACALPEIHALVAKVGSFQLALRELLQHFWRSNIHERESQNRIVKALSASTQEIKKCMDQTFTSRHTSLINPRALCVPLLEAIKTALDRYERLQVILDRAKTRSSTSEPCTS